jgi:hypothetical protein
MIIKFFEKFFAGMDYCVDSFTSMMIKLFNFLEYMFKVFVCIIEKILEFMECIFKLFFCTIEKILEFVVKPISFRRNKPPQPPDAPQHMQLRSAEEQLDRLLLEGDRSDNYGSSRSWPRHSPPPDWRPPPPTPPPSRIIREGTVSATSDLGAQDEYKFPIRETLNPERDCVSCFFGYIKDGDDVSRCWGTSSAHFKNIIFSDKTCDGWTAPLPIVPLQKSRSIRSIRTL